MLRSFKQRKDFFFLVVSDWWKGSLLSFLPQNTLKYLCAWIKEKRSTSYLFHRKTFPWIVYGVPIKQHGDLNTDKESSKHSVIHQKKQELQDTRDKAQTCWPHLQSWSTRHWGFLKLSSWWTHYRRGPPPADSESKLLWVSEHPWSSICRRWCVQWTHKNLCSLVASTWFGRTFQFAVAVAGSAWSQNKRTDPLQERRRPANFLPVMYM